MIYLRPIHFFLTLFIAAYGYTQCIDDDIIMFPPKSKSVFTGFGREVAISGDYLVTASTNNDSLAYESGLILVYHYSNERWNKVAELTPSDPRKGMQLGAELAITETTIAASATLWSPEGYRYEKVFVYEKPPGDPWTNRTESYILSPVETIAPDDFGGVRFNFDLNDDFLAISYSYGYRTQAHYEVKNNLYQLNSGSASLVASYEGIQDEHGQYRVADPYLGDDFLVLAVPDYQMNVYASGVVQIHSYEPVGGWNSLPARLTPSLPGQIGFGRSVTIEGNNVFVSNQYGDESNQRETHVFVFQKGGSSWTDMNESAVLSTQITGASAYNSKVVSSGEYLVHSLPNLRRLSVFKKNVAWQTKAAPDFVLETPDDKRLYGSSMAMNDDHFVTNVFDIGYTPDALFGSELNAYQLKTKTLEASVAGPDQVLYQHSYISSGDEFATESSFYKDIGAVGSVYDDDKGLFTGAVFMYTRDNENLKWTLDSKIYSPQPFSYEFFGNAVEVTDEWMFASSHNYDSLAADGSIVFSNIGKVYQFKKTAAGWEFFQDIKSPDFAGINQDVFADLKTSNPKFETYDPVTLELPSVDPKIDIDTRSRKESKQVDETSQHRNFGRKITYHNGYLAIGQRALGGSEYNGKIYVFKLGEHFGWNYVATLKVSDARRDLLGTSDIFMNDSLIVTGDVMSSCAYIFKKTGNEWESTTEHAKLLPDRRNGANGYPIEEFDWFGNDIDVKDDYIIVGAPLGERDSRVGDHSGRAYLYKMPQNGWNGHINTYQVLKPENRVLNGAFGYSVYIDDTNVLIGAPHYILRNNYTEYYNNDDGKYKPGKVYVFDRNHFDDSDPIVHEVGVIEPNEGVPLDGFGADISRNFIEVVVSAPFADTENGERSGSAYMYKRVSAIEEDLPPICAGDVTSIDLVAYPVTGGVWSGEGIIDAEKGIFDPSGLAGGMYQVVYQYGDCESSIDIEVQSKPVIMDSSEDLNMICEGGEVELFITSNKDDQSFRWYYRATTSDSFDRVDEWEGLNRIISERPGYYYCDVANTCGSEKRDFEVQLIQNSLDLNHPDDVTICRGESISLSLQSSTSQDQYFWYYRDVNTDRYNLIGTTSTVNISTFGKYYGRFENNGCTYFSDTLTLSEVPSPFSSSEMQLNYVDNHMICDNEFIQLRLNSGDQMDQYRWYFDGSGFGRFEEISSSYALETNKTGAYFCLFATNGCNYSSDTLNLERPDIELEFSPIAPICSFDRRIPLEASPQGGVFSLNGGAAFEQQLDPWGLENGEYEISYSVQVGNCSYSTSQMIIVDIIEVDELFIPNVFTPNGDGRNDSFKVVGASGSMGGFSLKVFDRTGRKVFETENPEFEWRGIDQPSGVYYWHLGFTTCDNNHKMKGFVNLLK